MATVKELLVRGKEILKERGRTTHQFEDKETGKVCALGALRSAVLGGGSPMSFVPGELWSQYRDACNALERAGVTADWNDNRATTDDDVLAGYDRAIAACD